jgi:hypothetical protein
MRARMVLLVFELAEPADSGSYGIANLTVLRVRTLSLRTLLSLRERRLVGAV